MPRLYLYYMKALPLAFLTLLLTIKTKAQESGRRHDDMGVIIGNVLDSASNKALPDVTVSLKSVGNDSTVISMITDKTGGFELEKLPFGLYRLLLTAVGYGNLSIDSINVRGDRFDFNLGDIKLRVKSNDMEEVVVYAEKPLLENRDGKITFNVGESALSSGSSTTELLKNMPLISNDAEGKILLKGKEPRILIDDKPTDMSAQQLADLLESLPGSAIEKIELMTNPGPEYASESGGVINIVTRKGKVGLTGRINLNYGTRGETSLTTNISYRNQKVSLNVTAGTGASYLKGGGYSLRSNIYKDSINSLNTENVFKNRNIRPNIRASLDYEINKQKSYNITAQFSGNYFDNDNTTEYTNINRFDAPYKISRRSTVSGGNSIIPSINATYTYKGVKRKDVFRITGSYSYSSNLNTRDFSQVFMDGNRVPTGVDSTQKQVTDNFTHTYSVRANYDRPISWRKSSLTFGGSLYRNLFNNLQNTYFLKKPERVMVEDPGLSNDFSFPQNIATLRAGITITIVEKLRFISAVQGEYTQFDFNLKNINQVSTNDYFNLLPTFTLRKDWINDYNASLVYRKTIRRPGVNELNPSINYNDPYNLRFGNPDLLPQLADNFDLNFGKTKGKFYINASIGYNSVKDIIKSIRTLQEDGKTNTTYQNISDRQEYEASMFGGYSFSRLLRLNASAGYSYNKYSEYDRTVNKYRNGGTFYTSVNYNVIISDRLSFDGVLRYNAIANPQGKSRSSLTQNLGMQAKFLNKRLIFTINLTDFLAQQKFTTFTTGSNFTLESVSNSNTRNIRIGFAYNLKKNRIKVSTKQNSKALPNTTFGKP